MSHESFRYVLDQGLIGQEDRRCETDLHQASCPVRRCAGGALQKTTFLKVFALGHVCLPRYDSEASERGGPLWRAQGFSEGVWQALLAVSNGHDKVLSVTLAASLNR